jgi:hypothetical protein
LLNELITQAEKSLAELSYPKYGKQELDGCKYRIEQMQVSMTKSYRGQSFTTRQASRKKDDCRKPH